MEGRLASRPYSFAAMELTTPRRWALNFCALSLVAAWLVANHYPPWVTSHSELLAAIAAGLLAIGALNKGSPPAIEVPAAALFFAAVAAIPLAQAAIGHVWFFGDAWIAALYLLCATWAVLWSARACTIDEHWTNRFATALLAGAMLSSIATLLQFFELNVGALALYIPSVPPGRSPFGNLAQPNQLTSLMGIGLAGLWLLYERRRVGGGWALTVALLLTLTMAMTRSRTALLLLGVGLLWQVGFGRRFHNLRMQRWILAGLATVWVALSLIWPTILKTLDREPLLASTASRLEAGPRTVIWSQLMQAVWERPLTGFGWNQVSVAQMMVAGDGPRSRWTEHSHNLLLDMMLWNGVPLALLILGICTWWAVRTLPRIRTENGAFGSLVMALLLAHSMVEFPLDYLYFLVPFGIALGLVVHDTKEDAVFTVSRWAGRGAMALFAAITAFSAIDYWRIEEAFREMRFTVARIGRPMVTQAPPMLTTAFTQLAAFHHFALTTPRPGMSAEKIEWMHKVAYRYGESPLLYRYALAQALNGDIEGARLTLLKMLNIHGEIPYSAAKRELIQLAATEYPVLLKLQLP